MQDQTKVAPAGRADSVRAARIILLELAVHGRLALGLLGTGERGACR